MGADAIVKSFIDRILRLKEEQDTLAADIREVYAEAKGNGYDKTALGEVVAYLRKVEKKGKDACEERDAAFGMYLDAYERASHTHACEGRSYAGTKAGEITEHEQPETPAEETHERPSTNDKAYLEAVPQDQASLAGTGSRMLAGREGRHEGEAASADLPTHSNPQPSPLSGADKPEAVSPPAVSGALSDDDVPAFLKKDQPRKTAKDYRPHCQRPEACGSSGLHHCYTCQKAINAAAESEAA